MLVASSPVCLPAEEWQIPWEAAKGDRKVVLPYRPVSLDRFLLEIPAGHEEADQDRKEGLKPASAKVRLLTTFRGRNVFEVTMEVKDSYYDRYHFIIAEVEEGRYMPIFGCQYAEGSLSLDESIVSSTDEKLELLVKSRVNGTDPGGPTYHLSLGKDFKPSFTETD